MHRVLVADYVHPVLITGLRDIGYHVLYAPEIERPQVLQWISTFSGMVINTKTVADAELLAAAEDLKWIARLGSGLDIIDQVIARNRGITVINTPEANANAVAEHVIGMLLCLLRNICRADSEVRQGIWQRERNRGSELSGKIVGIIGFGNTGSAFAKKLAGWDVRVIAYDKYKSGYASHMTHVLESSLEDVVSKSDIISLHLPLTTETRYYVDAKFLSLCKRGSILINSSRGKIAQTNAIVNALENGLLGGACLDVFENEKPDTYNSEDRALYDRLNAMRNVVLSPHIAGWTYESKIRIARQVVKEVARLDQG